MGVHMGELLQMVRSVDALPLPKPPLVSYAALPPPRQSTTPSGCRCVRYQSDSQWSVSAGRYVSRYGALRHAAPILEELAHEMAAVYAAHSHSCLLYLASILVDELYQEPACTQYLIGLLQSHADLICSRNRMV
ncbi:Transportin-3 [Eumeta japonica]|uniref:Transportin-3 n=1 Tax=Eumeta variegata TaxID=151549 RepID=A0A4C1WSA2_EUMVA|nr:Transportin-3 [Eumeta japonica]